MVNGQRSLRRAVTVGTFVVSLVLALAVPCIALAANTALFTSATPAKGSSISVYKPVISVIVYDKYGVSGSANYYLALDGVKKSTSLKKIIGWGTRKFKLSYAVPANLSIGGHTVRARVKDARGKTSTYDWSFTVLDGTAPVTTSDLVLNYTGAAAIHLSRSDNVGVTHTYYRVDNGTPQEGVSVVVSRGLTDPLYSLHKLAFWSVDAAGNVETINYEYFFIAPVAQTIAESHALPDVFCTTISGCHGTLGTDSSDIASLTVHPTADLPKIHDGNCFACHGAGVTPSADCATCHGAAGPHGQHVAITSSTNCTTCHTDAVVTLLHPSCETCHNSADPVVIAAIAGHHDTCEACHGSDFTVVHTTTEATNGHAVTTPIQTNNTCFYTPCHGTNVLTDHSVALPGGPTAHGCASCHGANAHAPHVDAIATPESSHTVYVTTVNCSQCHPTGINVHTNPAIPAAHVTTNGCSSVNTTFCHGTNVADIHATKKPTGTIAPPGCVACHATGVTPSTDCAHAGCHDGITMPLDPHTVTTLPAHVIATDPALFSCVSSGCHSGDVATVHTVWIAPAGCVACHAPGRTPSNNCVDCYFTGTGGLGAGHSRVLVGLGTASLHYVALPAGCISAGCHTTEHDLGQVHLLAGIQCLDCHDSGDSRVIAAVTGATGHDCVDCHNGNGGGANANPNLKAGHYSEFTDPLNVSGHNILGNVIGAISDFSATGVVVKDSAGDTITQDWPLPTSGVFWSQSVVVTDPVTAATLNPTDSPAVALANKGFSGDPTTLINKTVGWGSTIGCNDCHDAAAGIQAVGPHGATQTWVVDQNFPDDWTKAEITSFDPTGMRSIATTIGSPAVYYAKLGSKVWPPEGTVGSTTTANVYKNGSNVGTATISEGGFYDTTSTASTGYSAGVVTGRYICEKCHKLVNSYQGLGIEGNSRGFRDNNFAYIGFSNEAHMEHHADLVTGQANCVSCHIAIPHGWKRPRLLVYESDAAPYKVQWYFPNYSTASNASSLTADLSSGNWGFLGWNGLGSAPGASSRYKLVGAAIANGSVGTTTGGVWSNVNGVDHAAQNTVVNNSGKTYSSHLEKLSATATSLKELSAGPGDFDNDGDDSPFGANDVANGTLWGNWKQDKLGSEWLPDTSTFALYSGVAIQNNCGACSSAGLTHTDTGGSGEGVAETTVTGRLAVGGGVWSRIPFWK